MKNTANDTPPGNGAVYEWQGNHQVGKGRMEILESLAPSKTLIKLDFRKPVEAHGLRRFQPAGRALGRL